MTFLGASIGALPSCWLTSRSKSGSGQRPSLQGQGKSLKRNQLVVSFLQTRHTGSACASHTLRQCCVEPTFTSDARLALVCMKTSIGVSEEQSVLFREDLAAMSGAGVASRGADSVPLQAAVELPVRLYMRALRQYQKLLDLRRFTSKDKVSNSLLSLEILSLKFYQMTF